MPDASIKKGDRLIWWVVKRHFPFLYQRTRGDSFLREDINQIGLLCALQIAQTGPQYFRLVQRELYGFAKTLGYRRKRQGSWENREISIEDSGLK